MGWGSLSHFFFAGSGGGIVWGGVWTGVEGGGLIHTPLRVSEYILFAFIEIFFIRKRILSLLYCYKINSKVVQY